MKQSDERGQSMMLLGKAVSPEYFNKGAEFSNQVWGVWDDSGVCLNLASYLLKYKVMNKTTRRSIKNI